MENEKRIASAPELAVYPDGTMVHVGLVTGHNDGIDESGFDHRKLFDDYKKQGLYPHRISGIRVMAVKEAHFDGAKRKPHWRAFAEDVERIINDPESKYHKMAKEACISLLEERRFNDIVDDKIPEFEFGGCQAELPITADGKQHFADVGVWDHRQKDSPIAMEITYTSGQTKERILRLSQSGIYVYNFNILHRTRDQLTRGKDVDVKFYRDVMLRKKFSLKGDVDAVRPLKAFYLHVARLKEQEERRAAFEHIAMIRERKERLAMIREREKRLAYEALVQEDHQTQIERAKQRKAYELRRAEEIQRHAELLRRDAESKAVAEAQVKQDWETQKALCRRCAHSNPCPFSYAQKCGPDYQFTCA